MMNEFAFSFFALRASSIYPSKTPYGAMPRHRRARPAARTQPHKQRTPALEEVLLLLLKYYHYSYLFTTIIAIISTGTVVVANIPLLIPMCNSTFIKASLSVVVVC